jgi:flagellar hook-length control protein FliK
MAAAALGVTLASGDSAADKPTPAVPADLTAPANPDLSALSGQILITSVTSQSPIARTPETKSTDTNAGKRSLAINLSNSAVTDASAANSSILAVNSEGKASTGKPANTLPVIEAANTAAIVAAPASASALLAAQGTADADAHGMASFESILVRTQGGSAVSAEAVVAAQASASASVHADNTTKLAAATSNVAPALVVNTPLGNPGWTTDVGDKVMWMVGRQEQRVELVLNPPQLGRVEVSLTLNGDQATAQFLSANPVVREALENAMPRLREMLADGGINLGQTHVGSDSSGQAANQRENGDNRPGFGSGNAMLELPIRAGGAANQWLERGRGLVDVFA